VLLTNATKLDVSDIMSHAWFYTATSISHFSGIEWDGRCQKMAYSSDHCCSKLYIKYSRLALCIQSQTFTSVIKQQTITLFLINCNAQSICLVYDGH